MLCSAVINQDDAFSFWWQAILKKKGPRCLRWSVATASEKPALAHQLFGGLGMAAVLPATFHFDPYLLRQGVLGFLLGGLATYLAW